MRRASSGFTLIELMVTIAIISILAGIAYPAYLKQVERANRSDVRVALSDVAQRMQRCFTLFSKYDTDDGDCEVVDELKTADGVESIEGFYSVRIAAAADLTDATYLLTATAITGEKQETDEECVTYTLNQAGVRAAFDSDDADVTDVCW